MGLFSEVGVENAQMYPYINVGSMIDIATGTFELGINGEWLLNGGLAPITAVCGRAQTYKSTIVDSLIAQALIRYSRMDVLKYDTESNSFGLERFDKMAGKRIQDRITLSNMSTLPLPDFIEGLKAAQAFKMKNKKEYTVETPFLDANTGKPIVMWIPTIIDIDSFSCLRTSNETELMETLSVEDSKQNMTAMYDGKVKRSLMRMFSHWSYKYGMYFLMTAHVDDQYDLDPRKPSQKQLQWMKQSDRLKSVGSQFEFLTNILLQCVSPTPILDSSKKEAEYPNGSGTNVDINEVNLRLLRCKTNAAGTTIPLVMSQTLGILGDLSNYHYMKNNGDFGFNVKGHNRYSMLTPEVRLHRKDIISTLEANVEVCRGLEILSHLKWILNYWNVDKMNTNIPETAEKFIEMIVANDTIAISDILNSRGYWTYDKDNDRPYMSIMDILDILNGVKK